MKIATYVVAVLLFGAATASSRSTPTGDQSFDAFLGGFERGTSRFINGDPVPWKQNASHRDDVTLMGGWGTYKKGWTEVGPWYDWAAARFRDSAAEVKVEYLASEISGDLAYTVALERSTVRLIDQDKTAPMVLRVTQLFRRENGAWKLIHRHADAILSEIEPGAVLQKK